MEPIKRETKYIIFNKHNGVLFSHEDNEEVAYGYNSDHFVVKEVELLPTEYYFGDYETGQVYSIEEKPLVREDEMEEKFYENILFKYSAIKQIIILIDVLSKNKNINTTPEFDELVEFIKKQKHKYKEQLDVLNTDKDSFNFISIKEIAEIGQKRLEGIVF